MSEPALKLVEQEDPAKIFAEGGAEIAIQKIREFAATVHADPSTEKGRDAIKSAAYKVSREKTRYDDMGAEFVADLKAKAKVVDTQRKIIRDTFDTIRDAVRKPVDDWEAQESARINLLESMISSLVDKTNFTAPPTADEIASRIDAIQNFNFTDWQEYTERAESTKASALALLNRQLEEVRQQEADRAELARLRKQEMERKAEEARLEQERLARERDARLKEEAAAESKRLADEAEARAKKAEEDRKATELKAEEDRKAAAKALKEAEAKAEQDRKAAEKAAEEARIAAEAKAKKDAEEAVELERKRVADQKSKEEADAKAREADRAHKAKINNETASALIVLGASETVAKAIVAAMAKGEVPNVKISY